jgi:glycosyltransferase involved in cell wall biosynthesis
MSIIIIGDSFTFPEGNAATNHAYTYAKGFIENGAEVYVVCTRNEYLEKYDGISEGIKYFHPYARKVRSRHFIMRRWYGARKYIKTFTLLRRINREDKILTLNLWTYRLKTKLFAYFLARCFRTKLILERSEHPLRVFKEGTILSIIDELGVMIERKLYDGVFCMTNYLIEFYKSEGYNPARLFLVPSTVDTGRFKINSLPPLNFNYILYCGSLTILKDGVNILVESFNKISAKHPGINLVLIGKGDTADEEIIVRNLVSSLRMNGRIHLLGQLPRTEVPAYLVNAKVLALARPKSKIADAGFPSKLTEYLSTGNPVVVTRVGEIPFYLKDSENAFLVEPDDSAAFAGRLDYVLDNYELAKEVGIRGKELTETVFNYKYQAKRMLDFIQSLYQKNV